MNQKDSQNRNARAQLAAIQAVKKRDIWLAKGW